MSEEDFGQGFTTHSDGAAGGGGARRAESEAVERLNELANLNDGDSFAREIADLDLSVYRSGMLNPLHIASKKGFFKIFELALRAGVNIDFKDHEGYTSLMHAIIFDREEILAHLISKGASLKILDPVSSELPFHFAVRNNSLLSISTLAKYGRDKIDINSRDVAKSPLYLSLELSAFDAARVLLYSGADAAFSYRGTSIDDLVSELDVTKEGGYKFRKFYRANKPIKFEFLDACSNGNEKLAIALFRLFTNTSDTVGLFKGSVLHYACDNLLYGLIKEIVKINSSLIRIKDENGNTPLHLLLYNKIIDSDIEEVNKIIDLFVSLGFNILSYNTANHSVASIAQERNPSIYEHLLEKIDNSSSSSDWPYATEVIDQLTREEVPNTPLPGQVEEYDET
jgi:ankyrin repeat protein